MSDSTETPATRIAGDLAVAIHRGHIAAGARLPSQTQLMKSYGVAMGTAASALAKLTAAGLAKGQPGRGTFARDPRRSFEFADSPVLDVLAAADMCRELAALTFPDDTAPSLSVGGHPDWGTEWEDEDTAPPRRVDVAVLTGLDRNILRWMSEEFLSAARRLVGSGPGNNDRHLIAAARAFVRAGGLRPRDQEPIAVHGGSTPPDEDVVLRIWPERAEPLDPDGPPF